MTSDSGALPPPTIAGEPAENQHEQKNAKPFKNAAHHDELVGVTP